MRIKKIKLENIRSYVNQEIEFPEGSVLLSGDIGAGKSSVLLAMEFALFGLEKGSGASLLRNGKEHGTVELYLELENKEVIIRRTLKRNNKGVSQDVGFIIVNGNKEEGTATELKARILNLLNYPKEYLTKSKGLIYKYTVYTPQEEMKRILMENKEERLHVLRKVFDIDKYKRIQENAQLFVRHLRGEAKVYEERLKDLEFKKEEEKEKNKEIKEFLEELEKIIKEFRLSQEKVREKREEFKKFESEVRKLNELRNELNLIENSHEHRLKSKEDYEERIKNLKKEIKEIKEENFSEKIKENNSKLEDLKKEIRGQEEELSELKNKLIGFKTKEKHVKEIKEGIQELDLCPTCQQIVNLQHKEDISKKQEELINQFKIEIKNLSKLEQDHKDILEFKKEELEKLRKFIHELELKKLEYENNFRRKEELKRFEDGFRKIQVEIAKLEEEKSKLRKEIGNKIDVEEKHEKEKEELELRLREERAAEIKKSGMQEKINFYKENIKKLEGEIERLEQLNLKLENLRKIETWLEKYFLNLMSTIEKSVMFKLHSEFSDLFKKWFAIIIGNENLNVNLDEEFTPLITQEGYNIEYEDLSGGERTAAALAYRLSLNQVINNLISEIKTKDLLILDEPTDGFSSEQLDRVRTVLEELNMRQVIIVSHEAKVESFVDKILRFEKRNSVTEVLNE